MLLQQNKSKMGNAVMKGTARLPFIAVIVRPAIWMYKSKNEHTRYYSLLGCSTMQSCRWITTFQTNKAPSLFRLEPEDGNGTILRNIYPRTIFP
jgi:hypothetical protein